MKPKQYIVCPFCPLHCDDLQVEAGGGVDIDCSLARDALASTLNPTSPRIAKANVSLEEARNHIRNLVEGTVPVVVTSAVTLAAAKSLEQFHCDGRIEWMIQQSTTRAALTQTISRDGMIGATLAEVRHHADYIWTIGNRDQNLLPRIDEYISLTATPANRIGWPGGVTARQLGDLLDGIRRGEEPHESSLAEIYDAASKAAYLAVIWADDGFDPAEADVSSALLLELIAVLNDPKQRETRRAVLVTFDAGQTGRSVSLWRRNEAPRDSADLSIDDRSIIIRLGESVDSTKSVPLQIGGRDPGYEFAGVYVPTAVEGIHHADVVIRGDGSVTLPLKPFATSDLPTSREWLSVLLNS